MRLAAPAKLNLYLHVTGKRADGYHLLDGLVAFADVHDTLTLSPASALAFSIDGPFAPELADIESNLVVRAARALGAAAERRPDFAIHLIKRLPVASGIGGGSADAAACLTGLARLWDIDPAGPIVHGVAEALGADIPACVAGRAAYIGGVGTELTPAPKLPPAWLVLANPGVALPTADVYRARTGAFSRPMRLDNPPRGAVDLAAELALRTNDLTPPALACVPSIQNVLDALGLRIRDACCRACRAAAPPASDSAADADERRERDAAAIATGDAHPDWWVVPARLLENTAGLKPL